MYIVKIWDGEREMDWLSFETIESGRDFLSLVPGYHHTLSLEDGSIEEEMLNVCDFPDYGEISFKGNIVPISRHMFSSLSMVSLYFAPVVNMDRPQQGLIEGTTRVDAYLIDNCDLAAYIRARESRYQSIKRDLEDRGYEVERGFQGSEDGEAILYRRPDQPTWHFLTHMDPLFVRGDLVDMDELQG